MARILNRIERLVTGNAGDVKPVRVNKLRVNYGPGYRVYYKQVGNEIVLILCGGGDKSTQERDIKNAKAITAQCELQR